MYSQGKEENYIVSFFGDRKGTVLDIGANDGKTFSNSLRLTELGWNAVLVEPSPACVMKLHALHLEKNSVGAVKILQCAIGDTTEKKLFYESGKLNDPLLAGAENVSLVSTLKPEEKKRWEPLRMDWKEYEVSVYNWHDFKIFSNFKPGKDKFEFISIDAEGFDFEILKQIDLHETGTELLCVEYNSNSEMENKIMEHVATFGFTEIIYKSGENLLLCKKR